MRVEKTDSSATEVVFDTEIDSPEDEDAELEANEKTQIQLLEQTLVEAKKVRTTLTVEKSALVLSYDGNDAGRVARLAEHVSRYNTLIKAVNEEIEHLNKCIRGLTRMRGLAKRPLPNKTSNRRA